jgi:hypothetical protein
MSASKEEKRARLRAKAEEVIERYLTWEESHPRPDLMQIEDLVLQLRKEFGRELTQLALEEQAAKRPVPGPMCAQCGQEMRYKGEKAMQVESRTGALRITRGYYHCPHCKTGFSPPGSAVASA